MSMEITKKPQTTQDATTSWVTSKKQTTAKDATTSKDSAIMAQTTQVSATQTANEGPSTVMPISTVGQGKHYLNNYRIYFKT